MRSGTGPIINNPAFLRFVVISTKRRAWRDLASVAAKEATEAARDKIFQNIQYEEFTRFQKDCEKFGIFLHKASRESTLQGKNANYVEDELEKFVTSFNVEITKTSGADRDSLMDCYNALTARRSTVTAGNRDNILALLFDGKTENN